MKTPVNSMIFTTALLCLAVSCDYVRDMFPNGKSELTFLSTTSLQKNKGDTLLFTGNDIKWINGTTGEIRFVDSTFIPKIKPFFRLKCFLGPDSLFIATVTTPVMSSIVNDLVLNLDIKDGRFYFKDGYPEWINNPGITGIRIQNKAKRAFAWNRFLVELKKEGRYKE